MLLRWELGLGLLAASCSTPFVPPPVEPAIFAAGVACHSHLAAPETLLVADGADLSPPLSASIGAKRLIVTLEDEHQALRARIYDATAKTISLPIATRTLAPCTSSRSAPTSQPSGSQRP